MSLWFQTHSKNPPSTFTPAVSCKSSEYNTILNRTQIPHPPNNYVVSQSCKTVYTFEFKIYTNNNNVFHFNREVSRAPQIMLTLKIVIKISPILYFRQFSVIFPQPLIIW